MRSERCLILPVCCLNIYRAPIYGKSASNRLAWLRFTVNQLKQACMDSIYRKSASNRLAWTRFTVNQLKQACMDSIYRKSASIRLAWLRYTVYHAQAGLHGSDIQYISPEQACMAPIYSISRPNRLAWPDIQYITPKQACMAPIYSISSAMVSPQKKSPEPWTYHPCPGDFFMRSTVSAAYRRPPPLPPWRGGRLPRAAGSV